MSLTVGEAAAVLANYERRTGDTLSPADLQDRALADKLLPVNYDLKGQVLTALLIFPNVLGIISHLLNSKSTVYTRIFLMATNLTSHCYENRE